MTFRRRGVGISDPGTARGENVAVMGGKAVVPGVRPSPLDGRFTTSTGTRSLDTLLAGHAGLALGTSLLIEENGTTDFGGTLLRYYAAEGIVQGHQVHILGMSEAWGRELPGLSGAGRSDETKLSDEKMKIAWRYEMLEEFGTGARGGRSSIVLVHKLNIDLVHIQFQLLWLIAFQTDRNISQPTGCSATSDNPSIFCHDFDLSKRLVLPSAPLMYFVPTVTRPNIEFKFHDPSMSPLTAFLQHLTTQLSAASDETVHRVIIPNFLSPALYSSDSSKPDNLLQFLHALRAILRKYPAQVTAIITLPLALHPRATGLTRWIELLSDGVLELAPFPSTSVVTKAVPGTTAQEEPPQGILKIHRLPIFHEKGGGGGEASGFGDDLAFTLSRRKGLAIKPFSLPPVDGDPEAQQRGLDGDHDHDKASKVDIEF